MKQYLQPICEMMAIDANEDILTASFQLLDDNTDPNKVDSITW